ncbi:MAG: hypothetical protein A1D16_14160 [Flavihumibacter sp. CACIAM 22H1]|nr:MAG: hypothetical protein A1D16_14160 [Flavihumibacter sp. CACIAM 22H1]
MKAQAKEDLLVITDRSVYLSGESVFFSLYCIDSSLKNYAENSKLAYVELINQEKTAVVQSIVRLDKGRGQGVLYTNFQFSSGIYEFRAYTNWMRNWGESSYFRKPLLLVNPYDSSFFVENKKKLAATVSRSSATSRNDNQSPEAIIQLNAPVIPSRSLIECRVNFSTSIPASGLTVTVVPADEPELPEWVNEPSLSSGATKNIEFLPELEGPLIKVAVTDITNGEPVKNVMGILNSTGNAIIVSAAKTNQQGICWFNPGLRLQRGAIFAQILNAGKREDQLKLEIEHFFAPVSETISSGYPRLSEEQVELLRKRFIHLQLAADSQPTINLNDTSQLRFLDTIPFGKPDMRYRLKDYTRFLSMQEIFREFIPEVRVRKVDSLFQVKVRNKSIPGFFEGDPLILLDGQIITNPNFLLELNPLEIEEIEILMQKLIVNGLVNDGAILVKSNGKIAKTGVLPVHALTLFYPGIQQVVSTSWPDYAKKVPATDRIPDRRQLLYWSPKISDTDDLHEINIKFFSSDIPGKYRIRIRGLDSKLHPVDISTVFTVEN